MRGPRVRASFAATLLALLTGMPLGCGAVGVDSFTPAPGPPRTDTTGDGFGDLVVYARDPAGHARVDVWPGQQGGLEAEAHPLLADSVDLASARIAVADVTGDDRADLLTARPAPDDPGATEIRLV